MEPILSAAEQILRNSGAPALRLTMLAADLRGALGGLAVEVVRLRSVLEAHPERFRVLDPWRGPWRLLGDAHPSGEGDPWVVAVRDDGNGSAPHGPPTLSRRLRESVRWLGVQLDARSADCVIRWQGMLAEGMAAQQAIDRAA